MLPFALRDYSAGQEVRPGIWIDEARSGSQSARLVAPLYLGYSTKIGPSAVITRFSNLERRSQVGAGTVVENATILPHTVLGSGLEVSGGSGGRKQVRGSGSNIALQIEDPRLIRDATPSPWFAPAHRDPSYSRIARTKFPITDIRNICLERLEGFRKCYSRIGPKGEK